MAKTTLTQRQKQVYEFIRNYTQKYGYSPTYEEIGNAVNLSSTATIYNHIQALEKKGYINRQKNVSRGLELVAQDESSTKGGIQDTHTVPVLGRITGTTPLKEGKTSIEQIKIPKHMVDEDNTETFFVLEVEGNELVTEGLLHGDYVLFKYTDNLAEDNVYLVQVNGEMATIRRTKKEEKGIRLLSHTSALHNMLVEGADIHGKVVAVFRYYSTSSSTQQ